MAVSIAKTVKAVAVCLPPIIAVPRAVSAQSEVASTVAKAPVWLTEYVVSKTFHLSGSSPLTILVTHLYIELGESDLASEASLIIGGGAIVGEHHHTKVNGQPKPKLTVRGKQRTELMINAKQAHGH